MKRIAGILFFFITMSAMAQKDSLKIKTDSILSNTHLVDIPGMNNNPMSYDKIKLLNGDSMIVSIISETQNEIAFKYPLNTILNQVNLNKIREINYKDGKVKSFINKGLLPGVGAEPDNLWRIVVVTSNESEVAGLKEIGPISSRSEGKTPKTKIDILEKNATVFIQKKAVRMNSTKVLIKDKIIEQSYGEIPYVELKGIAYGPN
jgi:hypothetical protein